MLQSDEKKITITFTQISKQFFSKIVHSHHTNWYQEDGKK